MGGRCEPNTFAVDTVRPSLGRAFTGLLVDADETNCDVVTCELDGNMRDWVMAAFTDAHDLDGSTVDASDFVVEGHTVQKVMWFDVDGIVDDDAGDGPWVIRKLVFIQLADELNSDETPTVFLIPIAFGISDVAGNINFSDQAEADDRIGPKFVVSNFLPAPTSSSLVGDGVQVTFTVTADEETDAKPTVTVWDVFSPGTASDLNVTVTSAGINKWSAVVDEVGSDTATIYNIHIVGEDTVGNGSRLGIDNEDLEDPADLDEDGNIAEADGILDDFFETIIDIVMSPDPGFALFSNFDASDIDQDAIFFEGDTKDLAVPVTIPGEGQEFDFSGEPFVVLDFRGEGNEYPEDSHGLVTLLFAELDGVNVLPTASTEDSQSWLFPVTGLGIGPHTLAINAMDEAGNELADAAFTLQFTVTNVAPVVAAEPNQEGDEGSVLDLTLATFTDAIDTDAHTATIDWGDGVVEAGTVSEAGGSGTVSGSHTYVDDDGGPFDVTVTVTDSNGASASDTLLVTVNNVAPVLEAGGDQTVDASVAMSLDPATFTDAGALDTHSAIVIWGDGSLDVGIVDQASDTISQTHTYSTDGVFPVTIVLMDDDGGFDVDGFTATVGAGAVPVVDVRCLYDVNASLAIERDEAEAAAADYLLGLTAITRDDAVRVVVAYLLQQSFTCP